MVDECPWRKDTRKISPSNKDTARGHLSAGQEVAVTRNQIAHHLDLGLPGSGAARNNVCHFSHGDGGQSRAPSDRDAHQRDSPSAPSSSD